MLLRLISMGQLLIVMINSVSENVLIVNSMLMIFELVLFQSVESNVPTVLYKMDSNSITFSFPMQINRDIKIITRN